MGLHWSIKDVIMQNKAAKIAHDELVHRRPNVLAATENNYD